MEKFSADDLLLKYKYIGNSFSGSGVE